MMYENQVKAAQNQQYAAKQSHGIIGGQDAGLAIEQSEINRELQRMAKTVEYLHDCIEKLTGKLSPVCFSQPPSTEANSCGQIKPGCGSQVGQSIMNQEAGIDEAARKINDLISRIAV